jgi:Tol biopolymer transport system component
VPGADVADLSWSPNPGGGSGAHLLFTEHDHNTGIDSLVVAGPDGTNPRTVQAQASQPGWSPDGKQIVFVGQDAAGLDEIYTIGADGSGLSQITDNPGNGMCLH